MYYRYPSQIKRPIIRPSIQDEDDWAVSDEPQEEDSDSNAVVAESALDRMACGLGGKTMFPHILTATPQMLQQVFRGRPCPYPKLYPTNLTGNISSVT